MAISMARARGLCSKAELELVAASSKRGLAGMSAAEVRRAEGRARALRDKWRGQAAGQRRTSQAKVGARAAGANKNSAEKAALFDEVLGRFSARLGQLEAVGETAGPLGRQRSSRMARSRTHRASRAEARSALAAAKRELKSKKKSAKAAAPSAPPKRKKKERPPLGPVEVFPASGVAHRPLDEPPAEVKQPQRSGRPRGAGLSGLAAGRKVQGLRVTKKQQLQARTAAKQDRLKASGIVRIQTNRSGANRRQQGRRDAR